MRPSSRRGLTRVIETKGGIETEGRRPPFLLYSDDSGLQRSFTLEHNLPVTIGRGEEVDVSLSWDKSVSSVHAEAIRLGAKWLIRDEGISRNGTFVNSERVSGRRRLRHGDAGLRLEIRCGEQVGLSDQIPRGALQHAAQTESDGQWVAARELHRRQPGDMRLALVAESQAGSCRRHVVRIFNVAENADGAASRCAAGHIRPVRHAHRHLAASRTRARRRNRPSA